jgi:alpha-ribazole phosphatase
MTPPVIVWRHPKPLGAEGRCIGRTDLALDPRKAKRLARRVQRQARRLGLPRAVATSPLRRCAEVGRWLARWGWRHDVDPALVEIDFGGWDGQRWDDVPRAAIDAWCADFARSAPGGGESVRSLLERVRAWRPGPARIVVGHAGWLSGLAWIERHGDAEPAAACWPAPPAYGRFRSVVFEAAPGLDRPR